jgi:hypothetical protein
MKGLPLAEQGLLHEPGHAWSGGRAAESYSDAKGPDATCEILRFFFVAQPDAQPIGPHRCVRLRRWSPVQQSGSVAAGRMAAPHAARA